MQYDRKTTHAIMEGFFAGEELKEQQGSIDSVVTLAQIKRTNCIGNANATSQSFVFKSYTPWSLQAKYSEKVYSQPSSFERAQPKGCLATSHSTKDKANLHHSKSWRVVSAPSSYYYNHCEGTYSNGRGCTWTPYFFRFSHPQHTGQSVTRKVTSHKMLEAKPLRNVQLQASSDLKPTKSWIWSDHPQQAEQKCKGKKCEAFFNVMRSPYLRQNMSISSTTQMFSSKLQSSHKCEAWLKSTKNNL